LSKKFFEKQNAPTKQCCVCPVVVREMKVRLLPVALFEDAGARRSYKMNYHVAVVLAAGRTRFWPVRVCGYTPDDIAKAAEKDDRNNGGAPESAKGFPHVLVVLVIGFFQTTR